MTRKKYIYYHALQPLEQTIANHGQVARDNEIFVAIQFINILLISGYTFLALIEQTNLNFDLSSSVVASSTTLNPLWKVKSHKLLKVVFSLDFQFLKFASASATIINFESTSTTLVFYTMKGFSKIF